MKRSYLIVASLLAMWVTGPAMAGEKGHKEGHGGAGAEEWFKKADANADGKLSLEELKAVKPEATEEKFKKIDENADGAISLDEFKAAKAKRGGEHHKGGDPK